MTLGRSAHSGTQRNCSEYTQCGDEAKQLQCRANARCARSKGLASRQAMQHMEQKDVFRPGMTLGRSAHSGTQRNCSEYTQCGDEAKQLQCRANARCAL